MGEKDINPKEVMLQLEDELSLVELPCLVNEEVIEKFCKDLVYQRGQRNDDDSFENSTADRIL